MLQLCCGGIRARSSLQLAVYKCDDYHECYDRALSLSLPLSLPLSLLIKMSVNLSSGQQLQSKSRHAVPN